MERVRCHGNCRFGDDPRNGWRDADPDTYDGSRCYCVQCDNKEFCGNTWHDPDYMHHGPYCINCLVLGLGRLLFRNCPEDDTCAVCMGNDRQVKFPAADGCTHWFCIECTQKLIWGDSTRYELDPCTFGCPPCPNGCDNPVQGRQCMCEDYDAVKDEWKKMHQEDFDEWCAAEAEIEEAGEPPGSVLGKGECPLCKRVV